MLVIAVSRFLYWLLNVFFGQWGIENLMLTAICIAVVFIVYKMRGMFAFLVSLLVFTAFTILELLFFLPSLISFLSDFLWMLIRINFSTGVVAEGIFCTLDFITGFLSATIVFYLLTSEDLNSYLGTEAIFPVYRKPEGILARLDDLYKKGKIGEKAYKMLKEEYKEQEEA